MTALVNPLPRFFNETPERLFPSGYHGRPVRRSFIFGNYAYVVGTLHHASFIAMFYILEVPILALLNVGSVIVWLCAIALHRKGLLWQGYLVVAIEVIAHSAVCIYVIGWGAGFQYYLLIHPAIVFLLHWATPIKATIAAVWFIFFGILNYIAVAFSPLMELKPLYLVVINYNNLLCISTSLTIVVYIFHRNTAKAEEQVHREHKKTREALSEKKQVIALLDHELNEASDYVKTILPQPIEDNAIKIDWRFIPSKSLGGDAFGYHHLDEDHFALYLIDVSGHGVGAALLSASVINMLRSQSLPNTDFKKPEQVLRSLNIAFPSEGNKDMFFTMWYGVYNANIRELTYASGGHPPAILFNDDPESDTGIKLLRTPNYVIGGMPESTFKTGNCLVSEGSTLYIFSDGVYEVEKPDGSMWRFNEFTDYLQQVRTGNGSVLDRLYEHVKELGNSATLEDDFTILEVVFA